MKTETAQFLETLHRSIHSGPLLLPAPPEIHTCRTLSLHAYIFQTLTYALDYGNARRAGGTAEWYNDKIEEDTFAQLSSGEWVEYEHSQMCERCQNDFDYRSEDFSTVRASARYRNDSEEWCECCTRHRAFYCDRSEEYFCSNEFNQIEVEGETVCREVNEDEVHYWESDGEYHWDYEPEDADSDSNNVAGYQTCHREWKGRDYGAALLFGVELELKATDSRQDVADIATGFGFLAEEDGSLDDVYGIEIIGKPLAFSDYGRGDSAWQKFLRRVRGEAIGWDAGTGYGLHVSVNRRALTDYHVGKMLVFVNENRTLCEKVAGRKQVSWAEYKDKKLTHGKRDSSEKYEALAIRSRDRLEFRIFRSTLSIEGFLRAVEFTASIVEFSRISSAVRLTESAFRGFLALHAGEYRHLARHLGIAVPVRNKPLKLEPETAAA